jgi:hypothetical protein
VQHLENASGDIASEQGGKVMRQITSGSSGVGKHMRNIIKDIKADAKADFNALAEAAEKKLGGGKH